jgi:eukaryotic translation initiation factor 2C
MPPRPPPRGGRGSGPPPPPPRGAPPPQRSQAGPAATTGGPGQVVLAAHVQTIGVKKPGYGREGRPFSVVTNHFAAQITDNIISHYDGSSHPPVRLTCVDRADSMVLCTIYVIYSFVDYCLE